MAAHDIIEHPPIFNENPLEYYGVIEPKKIGKGSYGSVYKTDKNYAIKEIKRNLSAAISEIIYPSSLTHPGIIKYHDIYLEIDNCKIVMDLYEGDMSSLKVDAIPLFKSIAFQLVTTIAYLTSRNILHLDIKPQNILWKTCDQVGIKVVLSDFGLSVGHECYFRQYDTDVYTLWYRPPEVMLGTYYKENAEVWALGCTLYHIYTGKSLFVEVNEERAMINIYSRLGKLPPTSSIYSLYKSYEDLIKVNTPISPLIEDNPEINDLLLQMLNPDPDTRISIFDLQYHPYFSDLSGVELCKPLYIVTPNQCIDRVKLFDRHFTYHFETMTKRNSWVRILNGWMYEVIIELAIPEHLYLVTTDFIYRYLTLNPDLEAKYLQLVGVAAMSIVCDIFEEQIAESEFAYLSANIYTVEQILQMKIKMIQIFRYDLLATTPIDKIMAQQNESTIQAKNFLVSIAPIYELYILPNIVEICLELGTYQKGNPVSSEAENVISKLKIFYAQYPDIPTYVVKNLL